MAEIIKIWVEPNQRPIGMQIALPLKIMMVHFRYQDYSFKCEIRQAIEFLAQKRDVAALYLDGIARKHGF